MLRPLCVAVLLLAVAACTGGADEPDDGVPTAAPDLGSCRSLAPADLSRPSNTDPGVACSSDHTAETFAVGTVPRALARARPDDTSLGEYVGRRCGRQFQRFVGADDGRLLRTILGWAWFRPSADAWSHGARWYRCDVVGGAPGSPSLASLPRTAKGVLRGRLDERWRLCARGREVTGSVRVPCPEPHTWRAATTVVLGGAGARYPGDRRVAARTRELCSRSVAAWLRYPVSYDYGYTWYHAPQWRAGNRRSVCWAKTGR